MLKTEFCLISTLLQKSKKVTSQKKPASRNTNLLLISFEVMKYTNTKKSLKKCREKISGTTQVIYSFDAHLRRMEFNSYHM